MQCHIGYGILLSCDWSVGVALFCCISDWSLMLRVCSLRDSWMNWARATFKSMFGNLNPSRFWNASFQHLGQFLKGETLTLWQRHGKYQLCFILNLFPCELGTHFERGLWTGMEVILWGRGFGNNWNFKMMITRYRRVCSFFFFFLWLMGKVATITNVYYSSVLPTCWPLNNV